MIQPDELKTDAPLLWSSGRGTDVWALFNACMAGDLAEVRRLVAGDPSLGLRYEKWQRTPLHRFAREGNVEKADLFIEHGADLHARDEHIRSTPLAWAARHGRRNMVELLLTRGAKPNLADDPPWATPLAWATRRGHPAIAELLRLHGARA